MNKFFQSEAVPAFLLGALAFAVYLCTMAPSVGYEDSGELATVLHTMGVAHPSGYPLWTLLGHTFLHLPLGEARVIWKLNLFGAVATSVATILFFRLFLFILSDKVAGLFAGGRPSRTGTRVVERWAAATAALVLAFSRTYWSEALSLEVYALHLVFLAVVTRLFLAAMIAQRFERTPRAERLWILFAFTLGLSFAHHMMTVLLAPAFLFLFFRTMGTGKTAWHRILVAIPPFLVALSLYLYLLLRAAQKPLMNWGNPDSWGRFWDHVRAAQYGNQMFSSWEIAWRKLLQFAVDFPREFGHAPLVLLAAGLWVLGRRHREMLAFYLLIFFGCLFYAVNYAFDDPNFYLNAYMAAGLIIAFGARAILEAGQRRGFTWISRLGCTVAVAFPLFLNYQTLNMRRDYAIEDYTRNALNSMDTGAVFFSNEYERLGSPAYYLQIVEGIRPDVAVLDIILLGNPWYYGQLEARYPWLVSASRREIDAYRAEVDNYLEGTPDTAAHNRRLMEMFRSLVEKSRAEGRPVYVSSGISREILPEYQRVPSGLLFRLEPSAAEVPPPPFREFVIRPLPSAEANRVVERIRNDYAEGYANQAGYHVAMGDTTGGAALMRKALAMQPAFTEAARLLRDWERPH